MQQCFELTDFSLWLQFEQPGYECIYAFYALILSDNVSVSEFIAFEIIRHLNISHITDSYYGLKELKATQINHLFKTWLNILTALCLSDDIRESVEFEQHLKANYAQAESLQWTLLTDDSYNSLILEHFKQSTNYEFVFASRGTLILGNRAMLFARAHISRIFVLKFSDFLVLLSI